MKDFRRNHQCKHKRVITGLAFVPLVPNTLERGITIWPGKYGFTLARVNKCQDCGKSWSKDKYIGY